MVRWEVRAMNTRHGRGRTVREAMGSLGVKTVLLAYWGTAFVVSMGRKKPQVGVEESVRRNA
ncbi:hypothetical protein OHT52_30065 [Streptomyces sp. NBC_00247]|uniref:hypothetical protein n=1 Tax=Streptomyces sp. NBC_00247 TaxID=2975689 RepID=UPI002E2938AA|nr:hypothetical protein [Streptomyces sp. NBC_00247]